MILLFIAFLSSFIPVMAEELMPAYLEIGNPVCFSPRQRCYPKILHVIRRAKKSISLSMYDLSEQEMADLLIIKSRQIPVRIIAAEEMMSLERTKVRYLAKEGVDIRVPLRPTRGAMHSKWVIVDGVLETGSFDFSQSNAREDNLNYENQVYINSKSIVEAYQLEFERSWAEASPPEFWEKPTPIQKPDSKKNIKSNLKRIWNFVFWFFRQRD